MEVVLSGLLDFRRKDETHYLRCRHAIGRNGFDYYMPCVVLKIMPDRRRKVLVFGDRYWKARREKQSIRYVWPLKLKEI